MAASKVRLKLLIDKKGCKVLFAEAGKDFVEFLFYLLSLPAGTIVKLLGEKNMVGCLSSLYQSIETLSETSMQQNRHKNSVLNPTSPLTSPRSLSYCLVKNLTLESFIHVLILVIEIITPPFLVIAITMVVASLLITFTELMF